VAATWKTFLLVPLAIGGAAELTAEVVPPAGATLTAVRALVGAAPAADQDDPTLAPVDLPVAPMETVIAWKLPASDAQVVSWFAEFSPGGWQAGPVVEGVDLRPGFDTDLNAPLRWFLDRLKGLHAASPFLPDGRFEFREAYPRDVNGFPLGAVLVNQISPLPGPLNDMEGVDGPQVGDLRRYGRIHHVQMSCRAWFATPEERILGFNWLVKHIPIIAFFSSKAGFMEPTWHVVQEEDFESFGVPTFIAQATFEADIHCTFSTSIRTGYGRVLVS
jgi:hypothetical protein